MIMRATYRKHEHELHHLGIPLLVLAGVMVLLPLVWNAGVGLVGWANANTLIAFLDSLSFHRFMMSAPLHLLVTVEAVVGTTVAYHARTSRFAREVLAVLAVLYVATVVYASTW